MFQKCDICDGVYRILLKLTKIDPEFATIVDSGAQFMKHYIDFDGSIRFPCVSGDFWQISNIIVTKK